jgi:hypothetical protein
MAEKTVAALFDDYESAADAVRRLEAEGIRSGDNSLIAANQDNRYSQHAARRDDPALKEDDVRMTAVAGGEIGAGAGLLLGLALLAVPGLGPAIAGGWLVALLAGLGAVSGAAVAAALVRSGLTEEEAEAYAEGVRRGGTLVVVRVSEDKVARVREILRQAGAVDMEARATAWRREGWTGKAATAKA